MRNEKTPAQIAALDDASIHSILTTALARLLKHIDLTDSEMREVMIIIMQGRCPDALMGALLIALREKGESIGEISTCAAAMLELADTIDINTDNVVDIVGTGGDGSNLFNISTASAFVAAAAGTTIAKHGNRGVSTSSGSSDLLTQAGVKLDIPVSKTKEAIETLGIGFLFAPNHHPAMRHAIGVRKLLKVRTIFNILGPLTSPAHVKRSVIGVFSPELCEPLAHVLHKLGSEHVLVVHSADGLDEFSIAAPNRVAELKDGQVRVYDVAPEDLGLASKTLHGLSVPSSAESLTIIKAALSAGEVDATIAKAREMIALNAGAAIYVSGLVDSHIAGVNQALEIIKSGAAWDKLQSFAAFTQA